MPGSTRAQRRIWKRSISTWQDAAPDARHYFAIKPQQAANMGTSRQQAINDALERMFDIGFRTEEFGSVHGPMVAEAITALGRNDAVAPWIDVYKTKWHNIPAPPKQTAIDASKPAEWQRALGDPSRMSDWYELFLKEIEEKAWQDVLKTWAPVLIAGSAGGLTHGLIRTAHAVRSLQGDPPTKLQIDELARGLTYWAASYRAVSGNADAYGTLSLEQALVRLPRFDPTSAAPVVTDVIARFRALGELPGFTDTVENLEAVSNADEAISRHTAAIARILVAHTELRQVTFIQVVHALTSASAMRTILPYFPDAFGPWAYRRVWQVSAAILTQIGHVLRSELKLNPELSEPKLQIDELVDRAIAHKEEHVIKLTEACLREDRIRPDPAYRAAAEAALQRIKPWSERTVIR
jgi:hypothetical protein